MRIAAYLRYSSDAQRDASIEDQLRMVREYCTRQGWPEPAVFADRQISGARTDRAAYLQLLEAARRGEVDAIVCEDVSRLWRNLAEQSRVVEELEYVGVHVIGLNDGIDTRREGWELLMAVKGAINADARREIGRRTHRGLAGQVLAGYSAGGLPYGYRSVADGDGFRREIDPEQAAVVREIFIWFGLEGWATRRIARELNARGVPSARASSWAPSALYGDGRGLGMLNNQIYVGRQIWNRSRWIKPPGSNARKRVERPESEWIVVECPELRIIDEDLWLAVRARLDGRQRRKGGRPARHLLSGLMECGVCGGSFVIVDRYRYGCSHHKDRGTCSNSGKVARTHLEQQLLAHVKRQLSEEFYLDFVAELRRLQSEDKPDFVRLRAAIRTAERDVENLIAALRAGIISPTVRQELATAERQMEEAKRNLAEAERYQPEQLIPRLREIWLDLSARLEEIEDVDDAREALREILGAVRIIPSGGGLVAEISGGMMQLALLDNGGSGGWI